MEWSFPYFTKQEMTCKCGCGGVPRDSFMEKLVEIRKLTGFPMIISSGFRCPEYNITVADTGKNGPHTTGLAADVKVFGEQAFILLGLALRGGMTGIGVRQNGDFDSRFLHLDCLSPGGSHPRPRIWSY